MDFAVGWNSFNLTILGVWPEPKKISKLSRYATNLIFWFTMSISVSFICAPQMAHLILKSTNLDEVVENLSINMPVIFAVCKQIVLRYHRKALRFLLSQMLVDWTEPIMEENRQTMLKNAKLSRMISIVCSILTYQMIIAFLSLQIWSNIQHTSGVDLGGLLIPGTFPYDIHKSPNFEITIAGQLIGSITTAMCYSCFDTFLALLVLHLCGQLSVLRIALENLVDRTRNNDYKMFREQLGFIVRRQNELSRYVVIVEDCFNLMLLIQTLICTAMLCLTGYRMMTSVKEEQENVPIFGMIFFIIHVIYTMIHLFIYCYVGQILLGQSTGIGESAYNCNWYDLPPKHAVSLVLVICRAKLSFQITAGKFSPFSLELFNAVLKTSAGYLSMLLAMKDRLIEEK